MRTFVVAETGVLLSGIIEQLAPGDARSIGEGRVFVNRQRVVEPRQPLVAGAHVTWYLQRPADSRTGDLAFSIADRRGDLVVATKPAAWACEPDRAGSGSSLREAVAAELHTPEVHVLTRLDVGVSGLVLLGLSHSACRVAAQMQSRSQISKQYLGFVTGALASPITWSGPCGDRSATTEVRPLAACAVTSNKGRADTISLLAYKPITGRKHQIRIHTSRHGLPLLGDARYGGLMRLARADGAMISVPRIMLHAYRLDIPWENRTWSAVCAVPADLENFWTGFGGDAASLHP